MTPDERASGLYDVAQQEGALSIYTAIQSMEEIAEAFETRYPGIETSVYRASSDDVETRVRHEAEAGRPGADVLETSGLYLQADFADGILTDDFTPGDPDELAPGSARDGWVADRYVPIVPVWNTDLVAEGDVPQSLQDLADPKWKGKLAMEITDFDWFFTMSEHLVSTGMSESEVQTMFEQIASNSRQVGGHSEGVNLLAAGEFSIFVTSYVEAVIRLQGEGAPIAFRNGSGDIPIQPVFTNQTGVGILAEAAHPAAAALFADFLLGEEGQTVLHENGYIPAYTGISDVLDGVETLDADYAALSGNIEAQQAYEDLLTLASAGE